MAGNWNVIQFKSKRGEYPVSIFTSTLEKQTKSKIARMINLLEIYGNNVRMPYSRHIRKNIFELRIRGDQEIRIFYSFFGKSIILLHGFIKKTEQTPEKELVIAEQRQINCKT